MDKKLILALGVMGFALLVNIVATAIPYWLEFGVNIGEGTLYEDRLTTHSGLFQQCSSLTGQEAVCFNYSETDGVASWIKATGAMMILSILAMIAAIGLGIMYGFILKDKSMLPVLSAVMGFVSGGLAILGVIIYLAKTVENGMEGSLFVGFGLAIVAAVISFVGGLLMFRARATPQ